MAMTHQQAVMMSDDINAQGNTDCEANPERVRGDEYIVRVIAHAPGHGLYYVDLTVYVPARDKDLPA
jgi:hypothetical protein